MSTTPRDRRLELALLALAGIAAVAFYAGAFWIRGFRIPIGDDSFFYVGAIRAAGRLGLPTSHLAARPAYPLLGAALGSVLRSSPWITAVALPFAMAAGVGAAGAALAKRWGVRGWGPAAFLILGAASVVVGRLVAGRSENLLTVWLLAAALAVWAWADGRARLLGTGALVLAAGFTEWPFLAAFLGILGCAVALAWLAGARAEGRSLVLLGVVCAAATVGVAVVVFAVNGTVPGDAVQRLPPNSRYRPFLLETLEDFMPLLTVPAVVIGWIAARARGPGELRWLLGTWLAVTIAVVIIGLAGTALPTYRALTFALPVALATAAAPMLPAARRGSAPGSRRTVWTLVPAAVALAAILPGAVMWYWSFRPRTNDQELGQIATVASYASGLPAGTTVVATYDQPDVLKALYYEGVFDAMLPATMQGRVQIFPGPSDDALEGTPRLAPDAAGRDASRELFEDVRAALASGAPIVALRDFDPSAFSRERIKEVARVGPGVVVVRGPEPREDSSAASMVPLPEGWALLVWSVAMLGLLVAAGLGWSELVAVRAPPVVRLALAPAFGAAALVLPGIAVARSGTGLAGSVGPSIVAVAVAASLGMALWSRRRRPPG